MNKNKIRFYIVMAAVLVAFCVIALAVPFVKNGAYWISFAFAVLAIGLQLYAMPKAMNGDARSKFYGFPILRVSFFYLAAQIILSLVFMAVAKWVPLWIPAVVYIVMFCAALVGFIATDSVRDEVVQQDVSIKKKVETMRALQSKANSMAAQYEAGEAGAALKKLAEELRYSDPVSSDAIADAEANLSACIDNLQQAIIDGNEADILTICRKASAALEERNRLCKLNK